MNSTSNQLNRRRLTTAALVFTIIAASAPLTVLAGGVPTNYAVAGLLGVPQAYLILGLLLVVFAVGYTAMSRHVQNAGAFYAYVTEGLGPRSGIGAAVLALVSYNMMQIGLYGLFGFAGANLLAEFTGLSLPWWVIALAGWVLVAILGVNSIDLSAKVLGVIVILEFLAVIIVDLISFGSAPEGLATDAFAADQFFTPGIGILLSFGIAAFMGFESGAIYSEEVVDPRRTVSRATYIAVSIIAVFYAFSAWAFAVGIGPSVVIEQSQQYGPDLVFIWLGTFSPLLAKLVNLLFVTSLIAVLLAFHNAAARYFFSLGRSQVLPRFLGKTNKASAPGNGSATQSALALIVIIGFIIAGIGHPLGELFPVITLFTWLTNSAAFGLVFVMALTSVAVLVWFRKTPHGLGIGTRVIAPAIATLGLSIVFILILVNFDLMIEAESGSALVFILPSIIIGSGIVGFILGEVIRRRKPDVFDSMSNQDQIPHEEEFTLAATGAAVPDSSVAENEPTKN